MTQEKFEKTISLLKGVLDYESFKDVDIVIEVVRKACCFWFTVMLFCLKTRGKGLKYSSSMLGAGGY